MQEDRKAIIFDSLSCFSPVVQRIELKYPKLLIRVRFSTGLLEDLQKCWSFFMSFFEIIIKNWQW